MASGQTLIAPNNPGRNGRGPTLGISSTYTLHPRHTLKHRKKKIPRRRHPCIASTFWWRGESTLAAGKSAPREMSTVAQSWPAWQGPSWSNPAVGMVVEQRAGPVVPRACFVPRHPCQRTRARIIGGRRTYWSFMRWVTTHPPSQV
jgi:hypothetical protein